MTLPLVANAYGWDRAVAALLLHACAGETMSQRIGLYAREGRPWAVWAAGFLAWVVEPDHCERALSSDGQATGGRAAIMSGVLLLLLFLLFWIAAWGAGQAVCAVARTLF